MSPPSPTKVLPPALPVKMQDVTLPSPPKCYIWTPPPLDLQCLAFLVESGKLFFGLEIIKIESSLTFFPSQTKFCFNLSATTVTDAPIIGVRLGWDWGSWIDSKSNHEGPYGVTVSRSCESGCHYCAGVALSDDISWKGIMLVKIISQKLGPCAIVVRFGSLGCIKARHPPAISGVDKYPGCHTGNRTSALLTGGPSPIFTALPANWAPRTLAGEPPLFESEAPWRHPGQSGEKLFAWVQWMLPGQFVFLTACQLLCCSNIWQYGLQNFLSSKMQWKREALLSGCVLGSAHEAESFLINLWWSSEQNAIYVLEHRAEPRVMIS